MTHHIAMLFCFSTPNSAKPEFPVELLTGKKFIALLAMKTQLYSSLQAIKEISLNAKHKQAEFTI